MPWPIAVLTLWYAAIAAASGATLWQQLQRGIASSVWWPALWCGLSAALVLGLALLKPWARRLAVASSMLTAVGALSAAGLALLGAGPRPLASLVATGVGSAHLVLIRYLTRPHVKAWFTKSGPVTSGPVDCVGHRATEPPSHRATWV